jgi:ATPase subunit of ABC transporter with duplicated ATPase domains
MDEPTNDLDMVTLELLEEMLSDYKGTLLLISHDRAFMDNVSHQLGYLMVKAISMNTLVVIKII